MKVKSESEVAQSCPTLSDPMDCSLPTWKAVLLQEGDPYRELREGSCLTLGNELSEETHVLKKKKTFIG